MELNFVIERCGQPISMDGQNPRNSVAQKNTATEENWSTMENRSEFAKAMEIECIKTFFFFFLLKRTRFEFSKQNWSIMHKRTGWTSYSFAPLLSNSIYYNSFSSFHFSHMLDVMRTWCLFWFSLHLICMTWNDREYEANVAKQKKKIEKRHKINLNQ